MILLINSLNLERIPKPELIAGEAKPEDYDIFKYRILNDVEIDNWFYNVKSGKFYEVYIIDKVIFSWVNLNIEDNLSLYICSKEKIKRDIVYKGKIQKEEMMRNIYNLEHKINNINSKIDIICKYLNLNI